MDKADITPAVVARLVAEQFPQWAGLPVERVALDGWDNATFRLGDELSVRLPSADGYVAQVDKEHRWLPVLARHLPLPIPEPVARGEPGAGFPRPWSVYRWIEGGPASLEPVADLTRLAADLAEFLGALYAVDASDGPPPGWHNFFRGASPGTYDGDARRSIELLAADAHDIDTPEAHGVDSPDDDTPDTPDDDTPDTPDTDANDIDADDADPIDPLDAEAATEVWDAALASEWEQAPVWVHGDVSPSNLLVVDGTLRAVIDFGCLGVGDPACDLVMAWTFFDGESRAELRRRLPFDEATWARARGWALWKALITIVRHIEGGEDPLVAARRFGWRRSPREVVDLVLTDHARST